MANIHDVAREAGVSIGAVSMALSDNNKVSQRISAPTRKRVQEAAQLLGYRRNAHAKSMRTGRSNVIGVVSHSYPTVHHILRTDGLARALAEEGYHVSMQNLMWWPGRGPALLDELLGQRVDGLIVESGIDVGVEAPEIRGILRGLAAQHFPMVLMDYLRDDIRADRISTDREQGTYLAASHLLELGHRSIAFAIRMPEMGAHLQTRVRGFRKAHEERGLAVDEALFINTDFPENEVMSFSGVSYHTGYAAMAEVLQLNPLPTALMVTDDHVAIGALRAAQEAGVRVPEDIALVGFTGYPEGAYSRVPLTTVAFQYDAIGREAVRLLQEQIEAKGGPLEPRSLMLSPELVVRESCGAVINPK